MTETLSQEDVQKRIEEITGDFSKQQEIHALARRIHEYIKGNQWIEVDSAGFVHEIARDEEYFNDNREYRPRPSANVIFPIYRTYLAYLIKTRAHIRARPESTEDVMDLIGSRIGTRFVEYQYQTLMIEDKYLELCNTILKYGTGIGHDYWDKDVKENGFLVVPPSQFFPYPVGTTKWHQLRGCVWLRRVSTESLRMDYPDYEFAPDARFSDTQFLHPVDQEIVHSEETNLYDFWLLPSRGSPGCVARVASGNFLYGPGPFPYKEMKNRRGVFVLPFTPYFDNYLGDELFGFPTLGLVLDRQDDYNLGKSYLQQLQKFKPKLLVDHNSKVDPDAFVDTDARVLEYESRMGAQAPKYTAPPQYSPILVHEILSTPREMEHTVGFHDVTLRPSAEAIGSLQSGEGVKSLQAKDELRLVPALTWMLRGLVQDFEKLYALGRQYYNQNPEKLKNILGEMGEIDILTFKDIKLSPMKFTIEESTFNPYAEQVKQTKIAAVLPYGVINVQDPRERRKVLQYLDEKLADDFDVTTRDERRARVENMLMLKGEKAEVNLDDRDEVDLDVHNLIRKDFRFGKLAKKIRDAFDRHCDVHKKQLEEKFEMARAKMRQDQQPAQMPQPQPRQELQQPEPGGMA